MLRVLILILSLFFASTLVAQPHQESGSLPPAETPSESDPAKELRKNVIKKANKERQAQLQHDTEKLLKLATELKAYVDKTDEHILSLDVIKKAEEIEKLAHSVKVKMKTSY